MSNDEFPNVEWPTAGTRDKFVPITLHSSFGIARLIGLLSIFLLRIAAADPLPREIVPLPAVLEAKPDEDGRKVWHTRYFQIDSDMELRQNDLLRLAQVADTTAMVIKGQTLPLFAPPEGRRPRIAIYADPAEYVRAGAVHGSAGFYVSHRALVLVRGDFFVKGPDRPLLPANYDEDIVVHELVHLCMHRLNPALPQWLMEGLAEYFSCAHCGGGRFSFTDMDKSVREHLRSRLSPKDPGIPLVPVADVAGLGGRGWLKLMGSLPEEERYQAYATSLLLAHYHLHGGAQRLDALRKVLEAAKESYRDPQDRDPEGGRGWGRHREAEEPPKDVLLPADSAKTTQASLLRYWKPKGLTLEFTRK